MKPIACLIVLSLIFAFWSNSFIGSMASETPEGDVALEQPFDKLRPLLQRDQSPGPKWWTWDIWAEWLCPPRRKPRRWRRLSFLLCKLRRRYRQRVQRWRLLRQEWQELMEGRLRAEPLPKDVRASIPLPGARHRRDRVLHSRPGPSHHALRGAAAPGAARRRGLPDRLLPLAGRSTGISGGSNQESNGEWLLTANC